MATQLRRTRTQYLKRWEALKAERSSWMDHWREVTDFIQPRRGRYLVTDRNRGDGGASGGRRNGQIINGTPRRASRILASGMMAGISSPARPWFRLTTPEPSLAEVDEVRSWLHAVEEIIRTALVKSNIYTCLHTAYAGLGLHGTNATFVDEDPKTLLHGYSIPIGQYAIAANDRGDVDTIYREFSMTVKQLVDKFGLENCSQRVRDLYEQQKLDEWIVVLHSVEPNADYEEGKIGPRGKPFSSCWMEKDCGQDHEGFLRESGYDEFPAMVPRWDTEGEDIYGTSPGMDALPDSKALQLLEKRKLQLVDKITTPPMAAPTSLMNKTVSLLPGDVTYVDEGRAGNAFRPAVEVQPQAITVVGAEIKEHEKRIEECFYADLWLMMIESERSDITAREVNERHDEKMMQLGPVLERLHPELLARLVDRTFGILLRAGQIPPPPEQLQGVDLRIEFISILAQAQKLLGTTAIERMANFIIALSEKSPEALDKLNIDELIDTYADSLGINPDLIRSDDVVAEIRQKRAQAQQAQAQGEAMAAAAKGARDLSGASLENDNALTRMMGALGAAAPSVPGGEA